MRGFSRIIDKIENVSVISGALLSIDTKGLDCVIRPVGGNIMIRLSENGDGFAVKDGEEFTFCGKVFYDSDVSTEVNILYYHTL